MVRSRLAYAPGSFVEANIVGICLLTMIRTTRLVQWHTRGMPMLNGPLAVVWYPWTRLCSRLGATEFVLTRFSLFVLSMVVVSC